MRVQHRAAAWLLASTFLIAAAVAQAPATAPPAKHVAAPPLPQRTLCGRLEVHQGLTVLHAWGSPADRGYAHGFLLGDRVAAVATAEWTARFARHQPLLQQARAALDRLIAYPDDVKAEIEGLFAGMQDSKAVLDMPELERAFDLKDLMVANALDVFGLMGCSSFTMWGEQVVGGGVLTGRNFDWPLTGRHMLDATMLIVQHLPDGRAVASVGWPGFTGTVTGVSDEGLAVFLHVGSAKITMTPEPDSWPTAVAARAILAAGKGDDADGTFRESVRLLEYTSPPAGFLTHVVLPRANAGSSPVAVFETAVDSCVRAQLAAGACVLTNHFRTRADGRKASRDSLDREQRVATGIDGCLGEGDRQVSIEEAWTLLESVQRGRSHAFGTLHALVFRHEPWCFELRIGTIDEQGVVAAPVSARRHVLTREQVFPALAGR